MADLRDWLAQVEAMGELETLKGVPWDLEMGDSGISPLSSSTISRTIPRASAF